MKKSIRTYSTLFSCCLLLWGCSEKPNQVETGTGVTSTESAMVDTAGASGADMQEVEELTLRVIGNTMEEIAYSDDTLEVRAGSKVKLTFINEGVDMPMYHNVVFTKPDTYKRVAEAGARLGPSENYVPNDSAVIAATPIVLPGQTVELDFTAPAKAAAYNFVCTYPDHWKRSHGVLMVK